MANLTELAITKRPITYFVVFLLVVAGILSFSKLGRLEDPEFSIKTATITTSYPGASPEQVELEVTEPIERKIQEMSEIKDISSISRTGASIIKVNIKSQFWSDQLPQIWDVLRKKVNDITPQLPPGAATPVVGDDFGYVFGFLLAVSSDGFTHAELEQYSKDIQKELSIVPGVARVDLWGVQQRKIYLDIADTQYSQLGITPANLEHTLQLQNQVVDAGGVDYQEQRMTVSPTGEFSSPSEIGQLAVTPNWAGSDQSSADEIIRIQDFATVRTGYIDPPQQLMRYNGLPSIGIALAPLPGVNAVKVGQDVDQRITELNKMLPVGIEVHKISWQSDIVAESINAFLINLAEAVVIVLLVLAVSMGLRIGMIIGLSGLVLAILATFIVMYILHIDLQRVSLGALIIAMGMMVDNAIVVADGFVARLEQGVSRQQAAVESASTPAWPLLAATVVASMAFYPIYASTYDTGEYAGSLFVVVAAALLISWVLSQTVTPLMCMAFVPDPKKSTSAEAMYSGGFYQWFRRMLAAAIRRRLLFLACMIGLLVLSIWGFRFVPQMYFPDSSRLQFMVDYWAPEGTRIQQTSADIKTLETKLRHEKGVTSVSTFVGQGPPRFYLPVESEFPYSSYAQLIVNTDNAKTIDHLIKVLPEWGQQHLPQGMLRARKYAVGAFNNWQFEARFSGPANADPQVLRGIAQQAVDILKASPYAKEVRTDWRQRTLEVIPEYNQERARWAGVSRQDLAQAIKRSYDGVQVGLYREDDNLIPIVMRQPEADRQTAAVNLEQVQIASPLSRETVPSAQVLTDIQLQWHDPIIWRWDRRRAITVQCSPNGVTTPTLRSSVLEQFNNIKLPPGYTLEWKGEYNSSLESTEALIPGILPAIIIMLLLIVILFNAYRPPFIIIAVIPFVMIGVTFGLMITRVPFGFIALLGGMSLSGMMIKNSVVLLDQINLNLAQGMKPYEAVMDAAVSRLRPVINAAATTIFGMLPLLQDTFWVSMSVTIMFGLAFGTILTMVLVPVLYALLYRIKA